MNEKDSKKPDPKVFSVSELNLQARVTIEKQFNLVWVEGELSNFARPRSGHWYFTLKMTTLRFDVPCLPIEIDSHSFSPPMANKF